MQRVILVLAPCLLGSACYAQAAGSGRNTGLEFLPFLLLVPLVWFLVIKPVRKNMSEKNLGFLAAVSPGLYIVIGLILLGGALFSIMFGTDVAGDLRATRADRVFATKIIYSGYFVGVLGGILLIAGLFKGIVSTKI